LNAQSPKRAAHAENTTNTLHDMIPYADEQDDPNMLWVEAAMLPVIVASREKKLLLTPTVHARNIQEYKARRMCGIPLNGATPSNKNQAVNDTHDTCL